MVEALKDDLLLYYIIRGLEKDPVIPWRDVLSDMDRFLHSEMMKNYEEGSFRKDVFYFLEFISEAVES